MIPVRLLLLVTITFWGWSFVAAKICLNYMIPLEIIGLRCLLGLPVLLVIIFLKRLRPRFSLRDRNHRSVGGCHHYPFTDPSHRHEVHNRTNTGWLIAATPLALAVPYLKESFGVFSAAGGVMLLAGVYLTERRCSQ